MHTDVPMTRIQKLLVAGLVEKAKAIPAPGEGTYLDHECAATEVAEFAQTVLRSHWEGRGITVRRPQPRPGITWADLDYLTDEAIFDQRDVEEAMCWLEDALG